MTGQRQDTALLLVETQNEFMHPGGAFYSGIQKVVRHNGCFANLVEAARRARGQILLIYAPIAFSPGYPGLEGRTGVLARVKMAKALLRDGFGARFFSEMEPQPCDLILSDKRSISVFHQTELDQILRARGIRRLAICGFLTNICIESTVRSAYDYGYDVIVLKDATASLSLEEQAFCETRILPNFASVLSTNDFLAEIQR